MVLTAHQQVESIWEQNARSLFGSWKHKEPEKSNLTRKMKSNNIAVMTA